VVAIAEGKHPFPSRTRKLSLPAPMILRGQLRGKIGRRHSIRLHKLFSCTQITLDPLAYADGVVAIAEGKHPFPSRTRKLSLPAPMILRGQLRGKIGRRHSIRLHKLFSCTQITLDPLAYADGVVAIAEGKHPFPSRTRKLSLPAPMILRGQLRGKIGRRHSIRLSQAGFSFFLMLDFLWQICYTSNRKDNAYYLLQKSDDRESTHSRDVQRERVTDCKPFYGPGCRSSP
jgi:hypothetical protein